MAQWKGTASITINLFDWDSDLKIIKETERIYNVVVPESYTDISYYINNQKQSETSNNYKFRIPEKVGCYNLVDDPPKIAGRYTLGGNQPHGGLRQR